MNTYTYRSRKNRYFSQFLAVLRTKKSGWAASVGDAAGPDGRKGLLFFCDAGFDVRPYLLVNFG